jgi:hypothetical protein
MVPRIIGLVGPAGSGKSTLADMLEDKAGYNRTSFSAPIKDMLLALLRYQGADDKTAGRMLWGDLKEIATPLFGGASPRRAMQTLGTEWRDTLSRDLWIKIWGAKTLGTPRVVVEDMRYQHEAKVVRALGGTVVTVRRPGRHPVTGHLSETEWEDIVPDVYVVNREGDPDDMWTQLVGDLGRRGLELP